MEQRKHTFELIHGIKYGDKLQRTVTLRETTAGDIIDATAESEKLILTPDGYQLIPSPSLNGANLIRKQIESIGEIQAPIEDKDYRSLHPDDFKLLQEESEKFDKACLELVIKGEHGQSGEEITQSDSQTDK